VTSVTKASLYGLFVAIVTMIERPLMGLPGFPLRVAVIAWLVGFAIALLYIERRNRGAAQPQISNGEK
jgi:hypothetical protein